MSLYALRVFVLSSLLLGVSSLAVGAEPGSGKPWPGLAIAADRVLRSPVAEAVEPAPALERDGFRIHTAESPNLHLVLVERGRRLVLARMTIRFASPRTLSDKLGDYFDPPIVDGVRSGLGNVHRRSVRVRRPAAYAFQNGKGESSAGRILNRDIHRAKDFVESLAPGTTAGRVRRDERRTILADPGLDLVVRLLARSILGDAAALETRRHHIRFDFVDSLMAVRIQITAAKLDESARAAVEAVADAEPLRFANDGSRSSSRSAASLRRRVEGLQIPTVRKRR